MGDARELARECLDLWTGRTGTRNQGSGCCPIAQWAEVRRSLVMLASGGGCAFGERVGVLRHAVEVECERRGWGWEWVANPLEGYRFNVSVWSIEYGSDTFCNVAGLSKLAGSTALECALLALKWLLENPVEVVA
jgi:hypothetical protein